MSLGTRGPAEAVVFHKSALLLVALTVAFCAALFGCDKDKPARPPAEAPEKPSLRIYALAGAAGAVEPCGCVKDMLGGVDHAAAFIDKERKHAPVSLVLGAGPMFFADPAVKETEKAQARFKAETMAASLKDLGLVAWAPGENEWALGQAEMSRLSGVTGATVLAGNFPAEAGPVARSVLKQLGDMKVGIVGVSVPRSSESALPFAPTDARAALSLGKEEAQKQGADILIALISAQRGQALRLVEQVPGFHLVVVGKEYDQGESNDPVFAAERVGESLVVQAPNHLQGVSVVDLFVRGESKTFADGSGLSAQEEKKALARRAADLQARIDGWKKPDSGVDPKDIKAREGELQELTRRLKTFVEPVPPKSGSYFLYDLVEVRESHGADGKVASRLLAYYQRVNEHNKTAFADRVPEPAASGEPSYVGIEICSNCHEEERAVWQKTAHARAYETLETGHKEFNLDCVSCHVTGYEKPGGSTVTHVANLKDVQCEVCHGPGSSHADEPAKAGLIRRTPARTLCASACHHPPHVTPEWHVDKSWPKILGPGHGN